jgi:hypothetical protein
VNVTRDRKVQPEKELANLIRAIADTGHTPGMAEWNVLGNQPIANNGEEMRVWMVAGNAMLRTHSSFHSDLHWLQALEPKRVRGACGIAGTV